MSGQRVRVLVNDLQPYGAQRFAMTLAAAMRALGHAPELLLWDEAPGTGPSSCDGIPVNRLDRGRGGFPGFARQSLALASALRSDPTPLLGVLTYSNLVATAAAALSRSRVQVVVSEHNLTSVSMSSTDPRARAKFALMRRAYARAGAVVGVTDDVSTDLERLLGMPPRSVATILNPVDLDHVRGAAEGPPPHPWLADPTRPTVVCVGALRPAKGQVRLLRALVELDGVHALFVGDGTELDTLRACSAELRVADRVEFVGRKDNPYPWMRAADVVAVPSRWEGFGLVAVEAAALEVPLVGSDCGGLGEVLRLIGGRTVPQRSPHEDVEHARALAGALREALIVPAPAYVLDAFDPRAAARRYADLLGL